MTHVSVKQCESTYYNCLLDNYQPSKFLYVSTGIIKLGLCCIFFTIICNVFFL